MTREVKNKMQFLLVFVRKSEALDQEHTSLSNVSRNVCYSSAYTHNIFTFVHLLFYCVYYNALQMF